VLSCSRCEVTDKFIELIGKAKELDGRNMLWSDREDIATGMVKLAANVNGKIGVTL
jgi:hypothetical protein